MLPKTFFKNEMACEIPFKHLNEDNYCDMHIPKMATTAISQQYINKEWVDVSAWVVN